MKDTRWFPRMKKESEMSRPQRIKRAEQKKNWREEHHRELSAELSSIVIDLNKRNGFSK